MTIAKPAPTYNPIDMVVVRTRATPLRREVVAQKEEEKQQQQ